MSNQDNIIEISEYELKEIPPSFQFTSEEEKIIDMDFKDKIKLSYKSGNRCFIESQQFVGYIILPGHIINIKPKVTGISFINMVKYAMNLPELKIPQIKLKEINNYYHILVLFLLEELDILFQKGLNSGYVQYDDNITTVKGKMLFKEHLNSNYYRQDRIYCSFSELAVDILENRIIKYTLYSLCHCHFNDENIESKLLSCYNKLDYVNLTPISSDIFQSIQYTPLNNHYQNVMTLCELILKDSSIDDKYIGERTVKSFLIDMNQLFEKFVVNLLKERLSDYKIEAQITSYADTAEKTFKLIPDIIIKNLNEKSLLVLDTKYKKLDKSPESGDRDQVTSYSLFMQVMNIGLLYSGRKSEEDSIKSPIQLKQQINLHLLMFNLRADKESEFEERCSDFIKELLIILKGIEMNL